MPTAVPFEFVLERLDRLRPILKPMFGCHAVYIGEKIMIILRKKTDGRDDNGIWLATDREHHTSLRKEFPSLRRIRILGENSEWQVLPFDSDDFEENAMKLCDVILHNDPRIGKIPRARKAPRKKRKTSSRSSGQRK